MQFSTFFLTTLLASLSLTSALNIPDPNTSNDDFVKFTSKGLPYGLRSQDAYSCLEQGWNLLSSNRINTTICSRIGTSTDDIDRIFRFKSHSASNAKATGNLVWEDKNGKQSCLVKTSESSTITLGDCDSNATVFVVTKNVRGNLRIESQDNASKCSDGGIYAFGHCNVLETSIWILQKGKGNALS